MIRMSYMHYFSIHVIFVTIHFLCFQMYLPFHILRYCSIDSNKYGIKLLFMVSQVL